jgi:hypothetical protein
MQFNQRHIDLARELQSLRLPWTPAVGHYVYDVYGKIQQASPIQDRVFLIHDRDEFLKRAGGSEPFKQLMVWLPTWNDAREILRSLGVADADVELELVRKAAIADGTELLSLYELIAQRLSDEQLRVIYRGQARQVQQQDSP